MWGNIFFYALPSKIHKKGENYIVLHLNPTFSSLWMLDIIHFKLKICTWHFMKRKRRFSLEWLWMIHVPETDRGENWILAAKVDRDIFTHE